jgi:histidyl-tRNA synthetase
MSTLTTVRGFKDILPDQIHYWTKIEETTRNLAKRFDYSELRIPVLEKSELFARSIGESTDIVEKEMYSLEDKSGEKITLRPEATAGMVRSVLEHNLTEGGRPVKLFYLGPMFRYERPQKGRLRQFHQLDVEVFGDPGFHIDVEVISFLHTFLKELGLPSLSVIINSLGCPECRPIFRDKLINYLDSRRQGLCPDCQRRLVQNPLRVLDCKNPDCRQLSAESPLISEFLCSPCRSHFEGVKNSLTALNLNFTLDNRLVRGLDYYTRTTFEVHSGELGAQNAVAGGGRYDGLCQHLGGPSIPAVGFAAGLERLVMLLSEKESLPPVGPDYYVAILQPETLEPAFKLVHELRQKGLKVTVDWEAGSLKSRLKRADKSGATKVIMLGSDELAKAEVTIRDLSKKEQWSLPLYDYQNY